MIDFTKEYSKSEFINFLNNFLPDFETSEENIEINKKLNYLKSLNKIGQSKTIGVKVFEIDHESENDPRVSLSKESFILMKELSVDKALIIFKNNKSQNYRLSLITFESKWDEGTKIKTEFSNPRRYSFFLGPNSKTKTPNQFLVKNGIVKDVDDLKSRFSIEVVNKQFYKEISQAFTRLVNGLLKLPDIADKSQANLEFAVRLIGRIIFCWFLKEKKNENNNSLIPKELLSLEAISKHEDYYHNILEPIFFEILNRPIKERIDKFRVEPYSTIPYLNGGLFSPDKNSDYYKLGVYQSDFYNNLVVPDEWLKEFFNILETYNFTIDENTSYDEELSIDPEMLGRIFENLLAEINPETGESARKSTGSYYTPRVIVDYMIDESLLLYLKQHTDIKEEKLKAVISYELTDDVSNPLTLDEREKIVNALERVKILDPACGSGAFPIGALQKIVFILQQVDPDGSLWFKKQLAKASPEFRKDIEKKFTNKEYDFLRKLGVIRECIYGVDIQPIATEISRLRCFLTLIVDEKIDDNEENRGIKPLPNLDFKFVTANSLIGLPSVSKNEPQQPEMFDDHESIDELKNIRDQYFTSSGIDREKLKLEFSEQQKVLIKQMYKEHGYAGMAKSELTQKLTDWEPFTHKKADWFDPEWMFGIKDGFDIVIANPPYGETVKENKKYFKSNFISSEGKYEIFKFFIEKGIVLTKHGGILCFITPDTWLSLGYFNKLRKIILEENTIIKITESLYRIFENATVDNVVFWLRKRLSNKEESFSVLDNKFQHLRNIKFSELDKNVLRLQMKPQLIKKIESDNYPLSKYCEVWQGLIAYGTKIQSREFTSTEMDTEFHRKLLFGGDIKQYYIKWSGKYLKYGNWLHRPRPAYIFEMSKLLVQRIRNPKLNKRLVCAYDNSGFINGTGLSNILLINKSEGDLFLKYILSLLNSKLINYWFSFYYKDVNIKPDQLRNIPIKVASRADQELIVKLVDTIIQQKKLDFHSTVETENKIDQMVYKLYGLHEDEIKIVEGN